MWISQPSFMCILLIVLNIQIIEMHTYCLASENQVNDILSNFSFFSTKSTTSTIVLQVYNYLIFWII